MTDNSLRANLAGDFGRIVRASGSCLAALLLLLGAGSCVSPGAPPASSAPAQPPAAPAASAPCAGAEHRELDFWLGSWQVRTPDGNLAGTNRIEKKHGGCVLHESYTTGRGYSGESLNIYDATRQVWHQTWADSSGTLLQLEGGLRKGAMVLEGETLDAAGKPVRHRITWTPNPDGSVRQLWESTDAQGAWNVAFDGLYTRQ